MESAAASSSKGPAAPLAAAATGQKQSSSAAKAFRLSRIGPLRKAKRAPPKKQKKMRSSYFFGLSDSEDDDLDDEEDVDDLEDWQQYQAMGFEIDHTQAAEKRAAQASLVAAIADWKPLAAATTALPRGDEPRHFLATDACFNKVFEFLSNAARMRAEATCRRMYAYAIASWKTHSVLDLNSFLTDPANAKPHAALQLAARMGTAARTLRISSRDNHTVDWWDTDFVHLARVCPTLERIFFEVARNEHSAMFPWSFPIVRFDAFGALRVLHFSADSPGDRNSLFWTAFPETEDTALMESLSAGLVELSGLGDVRFSTAASAEAFFREHRALELLDCGAIQVGLRSSRPEAALREKQLPKIFDEIAAHCHHLKRIQLDRGSEISLAGIEKLKNMKVLALSSDERQLSGAQMTAIAKRNATTIERLLLVDCTSRLTKAALKAIARIGPQLCALHLGAAAHYMDDKHAAIDDKTLAPLIRAGRLEELVLYELSSITDATLDALATHCARSLQSFAFFAEPSSVSAAGIRRLCDAVVAANGWSAETCKQGDEAKRFNIDATMWCDEETRADYKRMQATLAGTASSDDDEEDEDEEDYGGTIEPMVDDGRRWPGVRLTLRYEEFVGVGWSRSRYWL